MDRQSCAYITGSCILVDEYQIFAVEIIDKSGSRVDHKRSTADDQHICFRDGADTFLDNLIIQSFFVENYIRADSSAAVAGWDSLRFFYNTCTVLLFATHAVIAVDTSMKL